MLAHTLGNIALSRVLHRPGPKGFGMALAVSLLAAHFFCWCQALKLAPLALLVPLTSLSHVLNAGLVGPLLGESMTAQRWSGTLMITLGVWMVLT